MNDDLNEKPALFMLVFVIAFITVLWCLGAKCDTWSPELHTGVTPHYDEWDGTFPDTCQRYAIQDMTRAIFLLKFRPANGVHYYECGRRHTEASAIIDAHKWARFIVRAAWEYDLPAWYVAALIGNESRFDNCAIGLYPRKFAYEHGIIKPNKYGISHSFEEVKAAVENPKMLKNFKNFDLGCLQNLDGFFPDSDKSQMMTWEGCEWGVSRLWKISHRYRTDKPWCYWPGYYAEWKCDKVEDWVRRLKRLSKGVKR